MKRKQFVIGVLVAAAAIGAALLMVRPASRYRITVLPSLGGRSADPHALNDRGQVVGLAEVADGSRHLFLWDRESGMQDLGPARGLFYLNNAGRIAGTTLDAGGYVQAFVWDPPAGQTMLGTLGGRQSRVMGLNDRGQVVGWSQTDTGFLHAFFWDSNDGMQDLGVAEWRVSGANALNDAGQILGFFEPVAGGGRSCCYWDLHDPNAPRGVPLPAGAWFDINSQGYVVGSTRPAQGRPCLLLWHNSTGAKTLLPLDRDSDRLQVSGASINDANQVVWREEVRSPWGRFSKRLFGPRVQSCLWDPRRGRISLDRSLPGGMRTFTARDLNNRGCLVGIVLATDGSARALLLEPIPERWKK